MKAIRLAVVVLACMSVVSGQQESPASVEGFVSSDLASVLPGTRIGLDSTIRGYHREAVTDVSGHYVIDEVQSGAYSLYAEATGYGCIIYPHVVLTPGQHLRQDFTFVRTRPGGCEPPDKKPKGK